MKKSKNWNSRSQCNIFSVYKVFNQIQNNIEIVEKYESSKSFSHLVVPGVASFGTAMKTLKEKIR